MAKYLCQMGLLCIFITYVSTSSLFASAYKLAGSHLDRASSVVSTHVPPFTTSAKPKYAPQGVRGPLKVSSNGRYFTYTDGTPFFYLADTAWELFHRLNRGEADTYLKDRADKGFNVIQAVVLAEQDGLRVANPYGHVPFHNLDPTKPNEDYFQHVDYIINKAESLGMYVGLLPTWGDKWNNWWGIGPQIFNATNAKTYGVWLANRYKNKPIIWILGGDRVPSSSAHYATIRAMAEGIRSVVGSSQLMTFHPEGKKTSASFFHNDTWLNFNTYQSGHYAYNYDLNYKLAADNYGRSPAKPSLNIEPCYEDHPVDWKPEKGWFNDYDARQAAYWSVLAGSAGHTYGNHNIWQFYDPNGQYSRIGNARTPWQQALDHAGAGQMKHVRKLMESRNMLSLVPDQSIIASGQGSGADYIVAARGTDFAFIYASTGQNLTVKLGKVSGQEIRGWWYSPRTGNGFHIGTFPNNGTKSFDAPGDKGRGNDWILILDDASKNYPAPDGTAAPTSTTNTTTPSAGIKIMPLGNSITQGYAGKPSYRRALWKQLQAAGYQVDFVGSQRGNHNGAAPHTDFDQDHQAHWGWRADEVLTQIGNWSLAHRPNIVLMHVGSNDMFQSQSVSSTISELSQIIDRIREANPNVKILLAKLIPPTEWQGRLGRINQLNDAIPGLAAQKNTTQSPVILVDHTLGFSASAHTYDGVHVNEAGAQKMADRWFAALTPLLSPAPNQAPQVSLAMSTTSFTAPATIALACNVTDADGSVSKVEYFVGNSKIGEATSAPWSYTWSNIGAGSYVVKVKATDNKGAATTSAALTLTVSAAAASPSPSPAPPAGTTFYRAINLNGPALTIDGNSWQGSTASHYTYSGTPFTDSNVALKSATDANRTSMIRSFIFSKNLRMTLTSVPSGNYQVYLYVWEDNHSQTYDIKVEGQTVKDNHNSGQAGNWSKLGPYTVNIADGTIEVAMVGGDANLSGVEVWKAAASAPPASNATSPPVVSCSATGTILQEVWTNVPGIAVTNIPVNNPPNVSNQLTIFEAPSHVGEQYGRRIRGYVCPPATGNYTFWIAGDDHSELWLSTNDNPSNKVKIAEVIGWTASREWTKYGSQRSGTIALQAGKKYYIEALHKDGTGADHLAVGWQLPNGTQERPIPGSRLSSFTPANPQACANTGGLLREYWADAAGCFIDDIPLNTPPTSTSVITSFEGPINIANHYASRIRGYLCAPVAGDYTFWVASDDNSELWISPDDNPARKVKVAYVSGWTNPRQWEKYPTQKSASVRLEPGRRYYVEVLHKDCSNGNYIGVGWQLPGGGLERPIPGIRLIPFNSNNVAEALNNLQATAVYPNPANNVATLTFRATEQRDVEIVVTNSLALEVMRIKGKASAGDNSFRLAVGGLARGVYYINVNNQYAEKLIISR